MSVITDIEKNIIESFISATAAGQVNWQKDRSRRFSCYAAQLAHNRQAFLDRSYAYTEGNPKECFNFSIIESETEVVIEVAKGLETDPVYQLLKGFYDQVDLRHKEKEYESLEPVLRQITGAFQK